MNRSSDLPDDVRDFERDLASLSPRPASARLKEKVAARLAPPSPGRWQVPLAALAACLAIAAAALLLLRPPLPAAPVPPVDPPVVTLDIPPIDPTLPTVIIYHRAYAESELLLDALLDAHAAYAHVGHAPPAAPQPPAQQRLFTLPSLIQTPVEESL